VDTPLRRLRKRLKRTLQQVADAIKSDTGNVSRIEQGKQCSPEQAEKLVEYFGRGSISEIEILYPERYPATKKRQGNRKVRTDMQGASRG
jgi:predicted transcriptional regulator